MMAGYKMDTGGRIFEAEMAINVNDNLSVTNS